jgi:hypothetical protein
LSGWDKENECAKKRETLLQKSKENLRERHANPFQGSPTSNTLKKSSKPFEMLRYRKKMMLTGLWKLN